MIYDWLLLNWFGIVVDCCGLLTYYIHSAESQQCVVSIMRLHALMMMSTKFEVKSNTKTYQLAFCNKMRFVETQFFIIMFRFMI